MKVLIACEYSGTVRDAFLARGHDAMSCDLLPTDLPGPSRRQSPFPGSLFTSSYDLQMPPRVAIPLAQ